MLLFLFLCLNASEFSNLARESISLSLNAVCRATEAVPLSTWGKSLISDKGKKEFFEKDNNFFSKKQKLLNKYIFSEQNFIYKVKSTGPN